MTTSGDITTYRYTATCDLVGATERDMSARLRDPRLLVTLVVVGLVFGTVLSLVTNAASLPYYLGRVLLIGVVWGLAWVALAGLLVVLAMPLGKVLNRRILARTFPEGSVTEVELGQDSLVIRRPHRTREVPYRSIFRIRTAGSVLHILARGQLSAEPLPVGMLPDDAIELIRTRSRGARQVSPAGPGSSTQQFVVPAGWAGHVAGVFTLATMRGRGFWVRIGLTLAVSGLLAVVAGPAWLVAVPVFAFLSVTTTYIRTRRMVAAVVPTGSVATTELLDDRFISRNVGGEREIRYDDIRSADVRGDVVLLRLDSQQQTMLMARALFPEDLLQRR